MKIIKLPLLLCFVLVFYSCQKELEREPQYNGPEQATAGKEHGHLKQTKTYSSAVLQQWINFDLRLLRANPAQLNNFVMMQHWAYSSIALYEAVVPGMPSYRSLSGQLNQMPAMPSVDHGVAYHWPTAANTVLAASIRFFYPSIPSADKVATDSLETALNTRYQQEVDAATFQRSVAFGKEVATRIFEWSKTDGSLTKHPVYNVPVGLGLWVATPPAFASPQNPYWGGNRPLMAGSVEASQLPPPPAYATDPSSEFYAHAKEVYDLSQQLTASQKASAIFWRDVPGGGHAHWLAIYSQVLYNEGDEVALDKAATVYAKMGITQSDARISCWKAKYTYNLVRPISYINAHIDREKDWNALLTTPNHPEYPSAHATFSSAAADILTLEFGDNYAFTDDTYNFPNLPPSNYRSFQQAAQDAGASRVFAGIHYWFSITAGNKQGSAVAKYLNDHIRFR